MWRSPRLRSTASVRGRPGFVRSHRRVIVYDLVYNPLETKLLIDARAAGCRTISGLEMLIAQAALQFELWTGRKPPIEEMRSAALAKITAHAADDIFEGGS